MLQEMQLAQIKMLEQLCEEKDFIQLKLNWDMLRSRDNCGTDCILYYENEILVGFIGLYGFGSKVELCGMVHPNYRREGIFSMLLTRALKLAAKLEFKEILLNAPSASKNATYFLEKSRCTFTFSEHQMKWTECELFHDDNVKLRHSIPGDLDVEIELDVRCFGFSKNDARQYNERIGRDTTQQFYMIVYAGKTVGKLRVTHTDGEAWIYGFAILPEYQGQGIGRKALTNIVINEHKNGYPIFLEVEAQNSHALGLYESCGFKALQSQDYYNLKW